MAKDNMVLLEKLRTALSETKFKTKLSKMYYYGTEEDAKVFVETLEECCKGNDSKR